MATSDVRSKKNATEEAQVASKAKHIKYLQKSPLVTPKSEARFEISVKNNIYKIKV